VRGIEGYLVEQHEEEVESGDDGGGEVYVGAQRLLTIVPAALGVRGSEDGGASVESGLDARFGN
jgi:hypothetical protein